MGVIQKRPVVAFALAALLGLLVIVTGSAIAVIAPGTTEWASSTAPGAPNTTRFSGAVSDPAGNTYAVGQVLGTVTVDFGNGVTVTGGSATANVLIVKYSPDGIAQWARSTAAEAPGDSIYQGVSMDAAGNIYAVGYIYGDTYGFGNGVTVTGGNANGSPVIVKYDSAGTAQWAKTTPNAPSYGSFTSVSVDGSGNIFAGGWIHGNGTFDFGGTAAAGAGSSDNPVLVKYSPAGAALWARSTTAAPLRAWFNGVSADRDGNIYAAGFIIGTGAFDFGGASVSGGYTGYNPVLVKYNASGGAVWARSTGVAPERSEFWCVTVDPSGNIYTGGYITDTGTFDFGNGATVAGANGTGGGVHTNPVVVSYDSSGAARWARSTVAATNVAYLNCIAADAYGNIYTAGHIEGNAEFGFGNGVTATGPGAVILKYGSDGTAKMAKPVTGGPNSNFGGVSTDAVGNSYAAGDIPGTTVYDFGDGVTVSGGYVGSNSVIVKYAGIYPEPATLPYSGR